MASESLPDREVLAELLLQWEELYEQGQDTPASELAKAYPDLIPELARRINALKTVSWITKPISETAASPHAPVSIRATGKVLGGRYRLEELVAEGGFAEVYKAYDTELQRIVAVKIPKRSHLSSAEAFLAEARRVARLKHDGIVPVHDVGTEGDTCFIVSEFLDGGSLADRLAGDRPTTQQAIIWITEVAEALEHAHQQGIVHRDIKPGNILINSHGRAKIADFGIAESVTTTREAAPSLGTLRYMSPEQLEGKAADHRSDLYSLGVVLYETLTGLVPFSSHEPSVIRREIVDGHTRFPKPVPKPLAGVITKALNRSPHLRQESAKDFAEDLRRAAATPFISKTHLGWAMVVGSVALGALLLIGRVGLPTHEPKHVVEPPPDTQPPTRAGEVTVSGFCPKPYLTGDVSAPSPAVAPYSSDEARQHQLTWAAYLGIPVESTNSIGATLVMIPPGTFKMGEENATRNVTLTMPIMVGRTEVTQGQWFQVMGSEPWKGQPPEHAKHAIEGPNVVATWVSWSDVVGFCKKLTEIEQTSGKIRPDQHYRLPTEAEWEYACRAGTDSAYSFGEEESLIGRYAWFGGGWRNGPSPGGNTSGQMYAHAVGLKLPNPWGLYDVHGNAWEWVADWRGEYPVRAETDPRGPSEGELRVYRGGSWYDSVDYCKSSSRNWGYPSHRYYGLGFRLVLTLL